MKISTELEDEMFNEMFLTGIGFDHSTNLQPNYEF